MILIIYLLIPALFTVEWFSQVLGILPNTATLVPDLLSVIAGLFVVIGVSTGRKIQMPRAYWILLAVFFVIIVGGIVINALEPLIVIAGMRAYLKFLPFFLLPIVYQFTEEQIRRCLLWILPFAILQLPIALYQRFILNPDAASGDMVGGSLGVSTSGVLSVFLCCCVAVLMGFYAKGRISVGLVAVLCVLLLIPTAINETKISFLMIPFVFMVPLFLAARGEQAIKRLAGISVMMCVFLTGFVVSYNYFISQYRTETLLDFLSDRERVEGYVYQGANTQYDTVGRLDSVLLAGRTLTREGKVVFGVGIGNASEGPTTSLTGRYFQRFWRMQPTKTFFTKIFWELGVIGPFLYLSFMFIVARTSLGLRWESGFIGALATSWVPITMILAGSFIYFKTFDRDIFTCLFWFIAGFLALSSSKVAAAKAQTQNAA